MAMDIVVDRKRGVFSCPPCQRSFGTEHSLLQHCRATARHAWCERCKQTFEDDDDLQTHLQSNITHRTCGTCGRVFKSVNNLRMHSVVHNDADTECIICDREFKTFSGMLIHLESGVCRDDVDVTDHFCDYVDYGNRSDVDYLRDGNGGILFVCQPCRKHFAHVSALFQHIESRTCEPDADAVEEFEDFLRA